MSGFDRFCEVLRFNSMGKFLTLSGTDCDWSPYAIGGASCVTISDGIAEISDGARWQDALEAGGKKVDRKVP